MLRECLLMISLCNEDSEVLLSENQMFTTTGELQNIRLVNHLFLKQNELKTELVRF